MANPQIEAMRKLGMDEAEIAQVLADDKRIDQGEKLFELTAEAEQESKKARNAGRKPTVYQFQKRERKTDNDKQMIIKFLISHLQNWFQSDSQCTYSACTNFDVTNPEREFSFTFNGKKYKLTLSCPRS